MIPFIAVVVVVLIGAAYTIGHYHGTQQCHEEVKLVADALKYIKGGNDDEKKSM